LNSVVQSQGLLLPDMSRQACKRQSYDMSEDLTTGSMRNGMPTTLDMAAVTSSHHSRPSHHFQQLTRMPLYLVWMVPFSGESMHD
jgi:hypothetical protein